MKKSGLSILVLYQWKDYPWTVGWSPVEELDGLGDFQIRHLSIYHETYEPYRKITRAHIRMARCRESLGALNEKQ